MPALTFLGRLPDHPSNHPDWWQAGCLIRPDGTKIGIIGDTTEFVPVAPPATRSAKLETGEQLTVGRGDAA
jgi:hypothetical protein